MRVRLPSTVTDPAELAPMLEPSALFREAIRNAIVDETGRINSAVD
jgi:hypothetical protein